MMHFQYLLVAVVYLLSADLSAKVYKGKYKYHLDVDHAEDIISGIKLPTPLTDEQWLNLLSGTEKRAPASVRGSGKKRSYKVKKGDNLWGISRSLLSEPFLWRKIWQSNPDLSNPHELEIGRVLALYREGDSQAVVRLPLVKLKPNGPTDIDNDAFAKLEIKNRFVPRIMVLSEEQFIGEITGSFSRKKSFDHHSDLFLILYSQENRKPGDKFHIVRGDRTVSDAVESGKVLGTVVRLIGELTLVGKGEKLFQGELSGIYSPVSRGDKLIPLQPSVQNNLSMNPPDDFETRIVTGEDIEKPTFAQGDFVLLNKGAHDGMKEGFRLRALLDTDPETKSKDDVEPTFKGEVQVIQVGPLASIGFVLRSSEPLTIGERLLPTQSFRNPPAPPRRQVETLELE